MLKFLEIRENTEVEIIITRVKRKEEEGITIADKLANKALDSDETSGMVVEASQNDVDIETTESEGPLCNICRECLQDDDKDVVQCHDCKQQVHFKCTCLPAYQITLFNDTGRRFTCEMCTQVDEDIVQLIEKRVVNIEKYELEEIKNDMCNSQEKIQRSDKMLMEEGDLKVTIKEELTDCKEKLNKEKELDQNQIKENEDEIKKVREELKECKEKLKAKEEDFKDKQRVLEIVNLRMTVRENEMQEKRKKN